MRIHFPVIAIAVGAGGLLFACTVTTTTNNNAPGDDAGSVQPVSDSSTTEPDTGTVTPGDDSGTDASDAATVTPQAYVRIAHWSPDAPAADVCFNTVGAAWTGQVPQLAQIVAAGDAGTLADGGSAGITFPQVTSYLIIPPDSYEVRLVMAGSTDCSTSLVDLASVTLAANSYTTIAAVGEAAPVATDQALSLVPFTDEVSAPAGQIALRFINAAPSMTLSPADLGTGSIAGTGGPFAPVFTGVAFGKTGGGSDAGAVDANGYVAIIPLATATLSAHPSSAAADGPIAVNDVTIAATSAATVALVNGVSNGLPSGNAKLLQCADVDDSAGASLLSTCSIISTQ
jgi:hypothetical protein